MSTVVACVMVVAFLATGAIPVSSAVYLEHPTVSGQSSLPLTLLLPSAAGRISSGGLIKASTATGQAIASTPGDLAIVPQDQTVIKNNGTPLYDEQIGLTFTQDFDELAYNVTAVAQSDSTGYGPAYLLNGLSNLGDWYQVGISYHWPSQNGGFAPGFGMSYQVYNAAGVAVYPTSGGGLTSFSGPVNPGDTVLLSLSFVADGMIQMLARDWNTSAASRATFTGAGATTFLGNTGRPGNTFGFFSGLMTEWYRETTYFGNVGKVVYSNPSTRLASAWMWIDEFNVHNASQIVFSSSSQSPITYANDQQIYPFSSNGATEYSSAYRFITGSLNVTSTRISLLSEGGTPRGEGNFTAYYLLLGIRQSIQFAANGTSLESDPGSSVTISGESSNSNSLERWVFNSGGSNVTFSSGSNVTYAFYDTVAQTVSYSTVGGDATIAPISLTYSVPPSMALPARTPQAASFVLSSAPSVIWAIRGSVARLNATLGQQKGGGERWATGVSNWTVSTPNGAANPILFYHQYLLALRYSTIGGGGGGAEDASSSPTFSSTTFGLPDAIKLTSSVQNSWFDAGGPFVFAGSLPGSTSTERWVLADPSSQAGKVNSSLELSVVYVHQYFVTLGVNDPGGGMVVSRESGWTEASTLLQASASASPNWQFEGWSGFGSEAYTGRNQIIFVNVTAPMTETARFYPGFTITADRGVDIGVRYGSTESRVPGGTSTTIFVPPGTGLNLSASAAFFAYTFDSWKGASNTSQHVISLTVVSPGSIRGVTTLDYYAALQLVAATGAAIALAVFVFRKRRRPQGNLDISAENASVYPVVTSLHNK